MAKKRSSRKPTGGGRRRTAAPKRPSRPSRAAVAAMPMPAAIETSHKPDESLIPGQIRPLTVPAGRMKTRGTGAAPPRLSNHKARSEWFRGRAAYPVREAPVLAMVRERERAFKAIPALAGTIHWDPAGPTNIGGRLTSIVAHPQNPDRIWVGAAGGGVWRSDDGGQNWTSLWYDQDVLNIGSLAIVPDNQDVLYCGTGEANGSADSYPGVGLYRSLDGGNEWHLHAARAKVSIPARIGAIAVDPADPQHILIGGIGYAEMSSDDDPNDLGGLYTSRDGGTTWSRETFVSKRNYWCHAIAFHPTDSQIIFATFTEQGSRSGLYRSPDGGATWTQIVKGLPDPSRFGRTAIAISPSNPEVMYLFAAEYHWQGADRLLGVFRSANGGASWKDITDAAHFLEERQIGYNNTIVVHPERPNYVLCGGVDLHLTTNGGASWTQVTYWNHDRGDADYAHADHHALLMPASAPGRVYSANDGGLDVSADGGRNWVNRSNGLAVTMFYDVEAAQSDARIIGGGAQDNGTVMTTSGSPGDYHEISGGDGGNMAIDQNDEGHFFVTEQHFFIARFRNNAWTDVPPPADTDEQRKVWMCPLALDPSDSEIVFTGSYRIWRSLDDGTNWTAVSGALDGGVITTIAIAPSDGQRVYVGTEYGGIFCSKDGGTSWSANIASSQLPGFSITRLAVSPANADVVYATVANFAFAHVFQSVDGGKSWNDIDRGELPNVPHHSVCVFDDGGAEAIAVASDAGVFVRDGKKIWRNATGNLPRVMVVDVMHHVRDRLLIAATYGRSFWRMKL